MSVFSRRYGSNTACLLAILLTTVPQLAAAQMGGMGGMQSVEQRLKSPAANQVFQRDLSGMVDVPVVLSEELKDAKVRAVSVSPMSMLGFRGGGMGDFRSKTVPLHEGKLIGIATGGPYYAQVAIEPKADGGAFFESGPFYVGDLWVLAGQSNMEGVGNLADVAGLNPATGGMGGMGMHPTAVMALGMYGKWGYAVEPLHSLVDSPDPVHSGDPATRAKRSEVEHKTRTKGAGLGLPFARALADETGVPFGLIPCAHGGTSMEQWSPSKKGEGGKSLYGSMLRQVKLAGGKVKGVLWYQGESDSIQGPALADAYSKTFTSFIAAVREDFEQSDLPFYYVQIGRFVYDGDPRPWKTVQEAQRTLPETVPHTGVVSVIDLPLDDGIHVSTLGLKHAGERLAKLVLRDQFGLTGGTTPTLDRVVKGRDNTLVVKFKGVNHTSHATGNAGPSGGLQPDRHIAGFSIHNADGKEIPLIYEAMVNTARDAVVLKLSGNIPEGASLWYGWGLDPYCNLTDTFDMAVPVFGPVALDKIK